MWFFWKRENNRYRKQISDCEGPGVKGGVDSKGAPTIKGSDGTIPHLDCLWGDYVTTHLSKLRTHCTLLCEKWIRTGMEKLVTDFSQNMSFDSMDNFMLLPQKSIVGLSILSENNVINCAYPKICGFLKPCDSNHNIFPNLMVNLEGSFSKPFHWWSRNVCLRLRNSFGFTGFLFLY